ncbi:MAG: PAS domain-containing sensor histidine kinase [Myxococcota bacterium]
MTLPELSPEALSVVLGSLLEGIVGARRGRICFVNAAFAELLGREASKLENLPIEDVIEVPGADPADYPEGVFEAVLKRPDGGRPSVRAERLMAQGGQSIWILGSASIPGGGPEDRAQTERALREAYEERLALEERLRQEVSDREDMVGLMSHELRTPVTVISGYSKLLLSEEVGGLNDVQRSFMEATARSCKRLSDLIGTLLEAAAQATGEIALELQDAALAPTIQDVVGMIKPLLEQKRVRLELEVQPDAARARFDASRVEQVLTNLLGNAIRYAPPLSIIRIATRRLATEGSLEDQVEVSISDEGPGVPAVDRERIFEPYVRAGELQAGGLGLGLAICRRLVDAHGGVVGLREAPSGGACFAFTLPLVGSVERET